MIKQDFADIGTLVKTHGIHGEIILELANPSFIENIKESVFIEIDGLPVPFFIASKSATSTMRYRVKFDWINTEKEIKKLVGLSVLIPKEELLVAQEDLSSTPALLIGFTAIDINQGELGEILDVIDNELNPLLVIDYNKTELLIPLHPDFILGIDADLKKVELETPEGLLSL